MKKLLTLLLVFALTASTASTFVGCNKHKCSFGEWVVDMEATCYVDGSKHRDCVADGCNKGEEGGVATEVEVIPAAHTMVDGKCSVCGYDPANAKTYKTYTSTSPSNWNELTYQDNNDTQIMSYIGSALFEYDFKFDADGNIVTGDFDIETSFATELNDLSAEYGYAKSGMVWEIKIREDGKWDNGDAITAHDFEYTMKEQLNPLFMNYRADSFYNGATVIKNAQAYVFQGQYSYKNMISEDYADDEYVAMDSFVVGEDGKITVDGKDICLDLNDGGNWGSAINQYFKANYFSYYRQAVDAEGNPVFEDKLDAEGKPVVDENGEVVKVPVYVQETDEEGNPVFDEKGNPVYVIDTLPAYLTLAAAETTDDGYIELTSELVNALSACIAWLHGYDSVEEYAAAKGGYAYIEWQEFAYYGATLNATWEDVGFKAVDDYTIVIELEKPLQLKKEDGSLSFKAAYNMSSLPLVHPATYEACKIEPEIEGGLWTSNYNSSLETTRSWGPYKLTYFQAGKFYVLEKNPHWYGYNMEKYEGQYETTRIECETITSYETAFMKFLSGDLTGIGIDASKAADYKNSSRAYFTPSDFVQSMQLQSSKKALNERQSEGVNKVLLTYADFRKAISLSFDRSTYTKTCTTSSLPGFGLFNSMHYYDVANGGAYRETDITKKVLCDVYGVNIDDYDSLDAAYDAITGYDLAQAKELLEKAYAEALEAGDIKATDKVVLTVGAAEDTESTRRLFNFIKTSLETLAEGTSLAGKLTADFNASFGDAWANDFRDGAYDICTGGWTGAAWDPGYFLLAYLDPNYMYSQAWDTSSHVIEITVHGVSERGAVTNNAEDSFTYETNLMTWYALLNNNFAEGVLANDFRLEIMAAIEKEILVQYYSVPIAYSFSASLISHQVEYLTYEYNTFNGYGGIQYMTYKYNDAQWAEYLKTHTLDYKA